MARLIVVDASVAIAALSAEETDDEGDRGDHPRGDLLDPSRIGATALATERDFVDGRAIVPVTSAIANNEALGRALWGAMSRTAGRAEQRWWSRLRSPGRAVLG